MSSVADFIKLEVITAIASWHIASTKLKFHKTRRWRPKRLALGAFNQRSGNVCVKLSQAFFQFDPITMKATRALHLTNKY